MTSVLLISLLLAYLVFAFDSAIRLVVTFAFIVAPSLLLYAKYDYVTRRLPFSRNLLWLGFPALLITGWFAHSAFYEFFGAERPDARFEKRTYSAMLYVLASPADSSIPPYRVPASILASYEEFEGRDSSHSERVYHIAYFDLPAGDRVTFKRHFESLRPRRQVILLDDQMRKWQIELTTDIVNP